MACRAGGAQPLGRSRCGLLQSALERHAAESSPKSHVTPLDAARRAARCCAPLDRSWFSLGYTFVGIDAYLWRLGGLKGRTFRRDISSCAHDLRSWFVSHAHAARFDAYYKARQCFLYRIARAHASYPRELAHISLTALARSAQCTGFYAWILDALSRARALTISRAWCTVAGAHAHLGPAHVGYTQNLKLVSLSFSPRQHAHCTPRTLASTHVCFERLTTEVENHRSTP